MTRGTAGIVVFLGVMALIATACSGSGSASFAAEQVASPSASTEETAAGQVGSSKVVLPGPPLSFEDTSYWGDAPVSIVLAPQGAVDPLVGGGQSGDLRPESVSQLYMLGPGPNAEADRRWRMLATDHEPILALAADDTSLYVLAERSDSSEVPAASEDSSADLVLGRAASDGTGWEWALVSPETLTLSGPPAGQERTFSFASAADGQLYLQDRLEPLVTEEDAENLAVAAGFQIDRRGRDGSTLVADRFGVHNHTEVEGAELPRCAQRLREAKTVASRVVDDEAEVASAFDLAAQVTDCAPRIECEIAAWAALNEPQRLATGMPAAVLANPEVQAVIGAHLLTEAEVCARERAAATLVESTFQDWNSLSAKIPESWTASSTWYTVDPDLLTLQRASPAEPTPTLSIEWSYDSDDVIAGGLQSRLIHQPLSGDSIRYSVAELAPDLDPEIAASYLFDTVASGPYGLVATAFRLEAVASVYEITGTLVFYSPDGERWGVTELEDVYVENLTVGQGHVMVATASAEYATLLDRPMPNIVWYGEVGTP